MSEHTDEIENLAVEGCRYRLSMVSIMSAFDDIVAFYDLEPEGQIFRDLAFASGAIARFQRIPPNLLNNDTTHGGDT